MDDILAKRKETFFNNLVLLGLDRITLEKKYGISFHKDMFVLPNKKGYEIVSHFLFSKLSSATDKNYNIPWPLLTKEQDRLFQKTCYSHLISFSLENTINFPRIVPSLLSTFGGDRFYEVYFAFSCYVIQKTVEKNGNIKLLSRPLPSQESFNTAKEIFQLSTILHMQKVKETENISYISHCIWLKFVKNLEDCLRKLKFLLKFTDDLLEKNKKHVSSILFKNPEKNLNLPKIIERSLETQKPLIKQMKIFDQFFDSEQKYWQYLSSEVGENVETEYLNGQDYSIQLSESLPEEYQSRLRNVECNTFKESGQLSVLRFIQLFMAYLEYIIEQLKKAELSELHKTCLIENSSSIVEDLNSLKNLNTRLCNEVIPDLEENIQKLNVKYSDEYGENLELLCDMLFSPLPISSFAVEAVKERVSHFDPSLERIYPLISSEEEMCNKELDDLSDENSIESGITSSDKQIPASNDVPSLSSHNFGTEIKYINPDTSHNMNDTRNLVHNSKISEVPVENHPLNSELKISALDDSDSAPSTHFKMSESWLHEESLNSMTLPDVSFDE